MPPTLPKPDWLSETELPKLVEAEEKIAAYLEKYTKGTAFQVEVQIMSPDLRRKKAVHFLLSRRRDGEPVRVASTITNGDTLIHNIKDWENVRKNGTPWVEAFRTKIEERVYIVAGKSRCRKTELRFDFLTKITALRSMRHPRHTKDRFIIRFTCKKSCCA